VLSRLAVRRQAVAAWSVALLMVAVAVAGPIIDWLILGNAIALAPWFLLEPTLLRLSLLAVRAGNEWWRET
jgi:hypothetical protein